MIAQLSSTSDPVDTLSWQLQEDVFQTVLVAVPEDFCRPTWVPQETGKRAGIFKNYVAVSSTADPRCFLDGLSSDHAWFVFWRSVEPLHQWIKAVLPDLCDQFHGVARLASIEVVFPPGISARWVMHLSRSPVQCRVAWLWWTPDR